MTSIAIRTGVSESEVHTASRAGKYEVCLTGALLALLAFGTSTIWMNRRWALSAFEAGLLALAAVWALRAAITGQRVFAAFPLAPIGLAVMVGLAQYASGATADAFQTRAEIVYWLVAFASVFLARQIFAQRSIRDFFLQVFLYFGVAISLVAVLQYHTSDGRVFWLFPARYEDMLGPFQNRNNFAAFLELLVPLALYRALVDHKRRTWYLVMTAILAAAAVASLSRAGTLLILAEAVVIFSIASGAGLLRRMDLIKVGACGVAAAGVLIFAVGWEPLWLRLQNADPLLYRREIMQSTVAMIQERPWTGFGLGAYQTVYPAFALFDVGLVVNHAHNEWLEWAAEGGLPLSVALLSIAVWAIGPALRSIWGLGVVAVFVHAVVDYPLQRLGVSAWVYVLLAALAAEADQRFEPRPSEQDVSP